MIAVSAGPRRTGVRREGTDRTMDDGERMTNGELYLRQMELLRCFLEHGTISRAQYDKSAGDLTRKMKTAQPGQKDGAEK